MGKSVAQIKAEEIPKSASSDENTSDEESEEPSASENESDDDDQEEKVNIKRSHSEDEQEEKRPKKTVKVEEVTKKAFGAEGATVWVGQLSFDATPDDIRDHFKSCGEISDIRLRLDPQTGRSRGFAHIDFTEKSGKAAAMELDGTTFMDRTIKVDNANPATPRVKDTNFGPKTNTVFMANLAHSLNEDSIREAFEKFGTIIGDIRLPFNRETGKIRGIAYVEFETDGQAEAAVKEMNGVSIEGRPIRTDFSGGDDTSRVRSRPPRGGFSGGRGRGGDRGRSFGGRGRGGDRGRGFGGRGRGRGRN
ncbi:hypothetical protein BD408DRAFT_383965 [Parasitella parasitica]|nr:hypothetical protein BD408DRAFT_383965 [Parasitella parasitica]